MPKIVTVLDFSVPSITQYFVELNAKEDVNEKLEDFIAGEGHNLSEVHWMLHDVEVEVEQKQGINIIK